MFRRKSNKPIHLTKWIVPFVIISIFTFTGLAMWVQIRSGIELSASLITCFFGFFGGELFMLASIKKAEMKKETEIEIASKRMEHISDTPEEIEIMCNGNINKYTRK